MIPLAIVTLGLVRALWSGITVTVELSSSSIRIRDRKILFDAPSARVASVEVDNRLRHFVIRDPDGRIIFRCHDSKLGGRANAVVISEEIRHLLALRKGEPVLATRVHGDVRNAC